MTCSAGTTELPLCGNSTTTKPRSKRMFVVVKNAEVLPQEVPNVSFRPKRVGTS